MAQSGACDHVEISFAIVLDISAFREKVESLCVPGECRGSIEGSGVYYRTQVHRGRPSVCRGGARRYPDVLATHAISPKCRTGGNEHLQPILADGRACVAPSPAQLGYEFPWPPSAIWPQGTHVNVVIAAGDAPRRTRSSARVIQLGDIAILTPKKGGAGVIVNCVHSAT